MHIRTTYSSKCDICILAKSHYEEYLFDICKYFIYVFIHLLCMCSACVCLVYMHTLCGMHVVFILCVNVYVLQVQLIKKR